MDANEGRGSEGWLSLRSDGGQTREWLAFSGDKVPSGACRGGVGFEPAHPKILVVGHETRGVFSQR